MRYYQNYLILSTNSMNNVQNDTSISLYYRAQGPPIPLASIEIGIFTFAGNGIA